MKICCKCKETKPLVEFVSKNKAAGIYQPYCKPCKREYNKKWYAQEKNKEAQVSRAKTNKRKYLDKMWQWKVEYVFVRGGCEWEDCDVTNPIMIEFDHLDRATKDYAIGDMFRRGHSIASIELEAQKCRLLCANHHRLWTAEQMGWYAPVLALPPKQPVHNG